MRERRLEMARRAREREERAREVARREQEERAARGAEVGEVAGRRRRSVWVDPIFQRRKELGQYHTLVSELRRNDRRFFQEFRMSTQQWDYLLERVTPAIQRQDTFWREAISPPERLAICLR